MSPLPASEHPCAHLAESIPIIIVAMKLGLQLTAVYDASTPHEQQLREQSSGIGPGTLSPEVKRVPSTPPRQAAPAPVRTPPRGQELRDVLNSSLATMRGLETRNSGPQPTQLVPIQELLYRGQSAIDRAAEIRRALKKSGAPPTRALVDELVDLVELAAAG